MSVGVLSMLLLKCYGADMGRKQISGAQGLYCIFYYVVCLHFGQVKMFILPPRGSLFASTHYTCLLLLSRSPAVTNHSQVMMCSADTDEGIFEEIRKGEIDFQIDPWPVISSSAKELVRKMLTQDPKKRITAAQVLGIKHEIVNYLVHFTKSIPPLRAVCMICRAPLA